MLPDLMRRRQASWCPACRAPAGPDCPETARERRIIRKAQRRQLVREIREELSDVAR